MKALIVILLALALQGCAMTAVKKAKDALFDGPKTDKVETPVIVQAPKPEKIPCPVQPVTHSCSEFTSHEFPLTVEIPEELIDQIHMQVLKQEPISPGVWAGLLHKFEESSNAYGKLRIFAKCSNGLVHLWEDSHGRCVGKPPDADENARDLY